MQFNVIILIITNVFIIAMMTSTHSEVGWSSQEFSFVIFALENSGTSVAVKFAAVTMQLDILTSV